MANGMTVQQWRDRLPSGRAQALLGGFEKTFGKRDTLRVFSAPGRTEIGGNHTDHQHGRVLAAAVNLDMLAAVSENDENVIRVQSEGYRMCAVSLDNLSVRANEVNTTLALIRGVAAKFREMGAKLRGFDAYVISDVLRGSGLSSSAAYEVLIGAIVNALCYDGKATSIEIAQIGQYAENVYFGKPSGLMDQMASSVGGFVAIDFADPKSPIVTPLAFDFGATGHSLCILDCGADHADLTGEYAAIPVELKKISAMFGKEVLRDVPEADFYARLPEIRKTAGDRAALRAIHFYGDNQRAGKQAEALQKGDFEEFLRLVRESGRSSWMYLQNVIPAGSTQHQDMALALALCEKLLCGRGAFRVHGGGFAGTAQAFVPNDLLPEFRAQFEAVFGAGSCHVLSVRPEGGVEL